MPRYVGHHMRIFKTDSDEEITMPTNVVESLSLFRICNLRSTSFE